jgi:hypothetical protein
MLREERSIPTLMQYNIIGREKEERSQYTRQGNSFAAK